MCIVVLYYLYDDNMILKHENIIAKECSLVIFNWLHTLRIECIYKNASYQSIITQFSDMRIKLIFN